MKKVIIAGMLLSFTLVTYAQSKTAKTKSAASASVQSNEDMVPKELSETQVKSAEHKAEVRAKALKTKLSLTDDQYKQVYDIEARYQKNCDKFPVGKVPSGFLSNITSEKKQHVAASTDRSAV